MNEVVECNISQYGASGNMVKVHEHQSDGEIHCAVFSTEEFNVKIEKIELEVEDNNKSEIGDITEGTLHCPGADQFVTNEDMNCIKNEYDLDIRRMIKEENTNQNQSDHSTKHFIEESGVEIDLKNEEINIKSEDDDMSESQNNPLGIKPYKKKLQPRGKPLTCETCSTCYPSRYQLASHKLFVHGDGPFYECDQCAYTTVYKNCLTGHALVHKNDSELQMYKCPECQFKSKYKTCLKRHTLTYHASIQMPQYGCDLCSYKAVAKRFLKCHELTHKDKSELPTYECFHCSYKTKRKPDLCKHMKRHELVQVPIPVVHIQEPYKCNICSFVTKYKTSLARHFGMLHKDKPVPVYHCDKCLFETVCKTTLSKHMLIHIDSPRIKVYKCEICPHQVTSKYQLKQHTLTHQKVKQPFLSIYKCTHCSFQCEDKSRYKTHLLHSHNDKSPVRTPLFKCPQCSYQTTYKARIIGHVHSHINRSGIKLYTCEVCGGKYNKGYLAMHQRTCLGQEAVRPL